MAFPIWLTPAGDLGTVPEAEYYQYKLDAYSDSGGTLVYEKLSGILPPGIQITKTGYLQGIPISVAGPDLNQIYFFTVRATVFQNGARTNLISDRTFKLTITNVAPPIIVPRNVDLGEYFDGQPINIQLRATEFILGGNLVWSLKSGDLPPGLSISATGQITGFINLIPVLGPGSDPGWDDTEWDEKFTYANTASNLGWDFPLGTAAKHFEFTVEVTDGALSDVSTYKMYVLPKKAVTADAILLTADTVTINNGNALVGGSFTVNELTVDSTKLHSPIILSAYDDIPAQRQTSWFSFQIKAIDFDGDTLQYTIPSQTAGTFDEQSIIGQASYIGLGVDKNSSGWVSTALVLPGSNTPYLTAGDSIQVLEPYTDIVTGQQSYTWYNATVNNYGKIRLTGNTIITANVGDSITQSIGGANATIVDFTATTGNIMLGGGRVQVAIETAGNLVISANVGDIVTQNGSTGNAKLISNVRLGSILYAEYNLGTFSLTAGNLKIKGSNIATYPVNLTTTTVGTYLNANVGDIITQSTTGANATVIKSHTNINTGLSNPRVYEVQFNSGQFATGPTGGNLKLNGSNVAVYPTAINTQADIEFSYNTADVFVINEPTDSGLVYIDSRNSFARPTEFLSIGVTTGGLSTQGTKGFDSTKFDQESLTLPGNIVIDLNTGRIAGYLPGQNTNIVTYNFECVVYKKDYPNYQASQLFKVTVYGDLSNLVEWITPSYLGTIEVGEVSEFSVKAVNLKGKPLYYYYTPNTYINQVQGLRLQPDGLISGRASFELFSLDSGQTTFDANFINENPTTTFDQTFEFTITSQTYDQTSSSERRFTILVRNRRFGKSIRPYDNLYFRAQLDQRQRSKFRDVLNNKNIFPPNRIYRITDPWFGTAKSLRSLFLAGLNPKELSTWYQAINTNHFQKRLLFSEIKTAVARIDGVYDVIENATGSTIGTLNVYTNMFVPYTVNAGYKVLTNVKSISDSVVTGSNSLPTGTSIGQQTIKYEVVYAELLDENTNDFGQGPPDLINLSGELYNPYYDRSGNTFVVAAPNSFNNMDNVVTSKIGFEDKGVLPDWMTSPQENNQQLGFVRSVVFAYTVPGAAKSIAWKLKEENIEFNELNFLVDRYHLDSVYSQNFDLDTDAFILSRETTYDRYPALNSVFSYVASVDYAVNQSFESINEKAASEIIADGGLDGVKYFQNGETLVFFEQEFRIGESLSNTYNQGWALSLAPWDESSTVDPTKGEWDYKGTLGWDPAGYVPGYREWLESRQFFGNVAYFSAPNQRVGIWRINIDQTGYVSLHLANVSLTVRGTSANTTGFGSNITVNNTNNIFIGMPVKGSGLSDYATITDINGANITIYPAISGTISSVITAVPTPTFNNSLFVRNGTTHGGTNIYFDPFVKAGKTVPNYSEISQQIKTRGTTFDGDGTKFYDYRDNYVIPEQGEKTIDFPRLNVFT